MPRPPKPLALHLISGAIKKNPGRFRRRTAEPTRKEPVGDPPTWFDEPSSLPTGYLRNAWYELIKECPIDLSIADRQQLELCCVLKGQVYRKRRDRDLPASLVSELSKQLALLGFNPFARAKMSMPSGEEAPGDKLKKFVQRTKAG